MVLQNYRNFSMCDDFNKVFGKTIEQNAITGSEKPKKRRKYYLILQYLSGPDAECSAPLALNAISDRDDYI